MRTEESQIFIQRNAIELRERNGTIRWTLPTSEVVEIAAWKDDLFAYDVICFGFRRINETHFLQCNEEMQGWEELQEFLKARFGIEDWFEKIAFPAFVPNFTSLWGEPVSDHI
jgi:hypothetical protein